jgi:hypothetical protein
MQVVAAVVKTGSYPQAEMVAVAPAALIKEHQPLQVHQIPAAVVAEVVVQ